jgi:hypothetical protein
LCGCPHRTVGVKILCPKGPVLGPSYRHPPGMHMVLIPVACHFCFCYFETRVLKETLCWWQEPHFTCVGCSSVTGGGVGIGGDRRRWCLIGCLWCHGSQCQYHREHGPEWCGPSPRVFGRHEPGVAWFVLTWLFWLCIPTYQLEVSGKRG